MNEIVYTSIETRYASFERQSPSQYIRRCIDNSRTGSNKCVGYCQYSEHPGFLTAELRKKHDCINKRCCHYIPKSSKTSNIAPDRFAERKDEVIKIVQCKVKQFEGMKILKTDHSADGTWIFHYITISNEYPLTEISKAIENEWGFPVSWKKLNYSFDNCVRLILENECCRRSVYA